MRKDHAAKITVKLQQNFKNMKLKNGARSVRSAASTAADSSGGGLGGAGASSRGGVWRELENLELLPPEQPRD